MARYGYARPRERLDLRRGDQLSSWRVDSPSLNGVRSTAGQRRVPQDHHRCACAPRHAERSGATVHHFGHAAEQDETDDDRPQDRVAFGRMHDWDHAATHGRQSCTAHGEQDFVTSRTGRSVRIDPASGAGCRSVGLCEQVAHQYDAWSAQVTDDIEFSVGLACQSDRPLVELAVACAPDVRTVIDHLCELRMVR